MKYSDIFQPSHTPKQYREAGKEYDALNRDIRKARSLIEDAMARYRKVLTRSASKKQAQQPDLFKDLEGYSCREQINNDWGMDYITARERDRLFRLWDLREENQIDPAGLATDRVLEMLRCAANGIAGQYAEDLTRFEDMQAEQRRHEEDVRLAQIAAHEQKPESRL